MDSPVRKQLKRNDYLRHKMFRKIKRRRKAERELAINAPAKELRRRLRRRTFKCGKDAYEDGKDEIMFSEVQQPLYDQYGNLLDPNTGMIGTTVLPNIEVVADPDDVARGRAAQWYKDFGIESNDATSTPLTTNHHLKQRSEEGAAKAAAWAKDHPYLNMTGLAVGTAPFAVAAAPVAVGGGELVGQALANPYVDAAMTSVFGAHGIQNLMNGTANWETALEIAPLTRLAKPIFNAGVKLLNRTFPMPDLRIPQRSAGLNIPAQDAGLLDLAPVVENQVSDLLSVALKNTAKRDFENRFVTPGFQLKILHKGSPLEKQVSKAGTVSTNNIVALASKASEMEKYVIDKVLKERFSDLKNVNYLDFKKAVLDELITYNKFRTDLWADYGISRLGYEQNPPFKVDYPKIDAFTFENRSRILQGNNKHFGDRPGTLGHTRTFTTQDDPYILHVAESQSDWAQRYYKEGEGANNYKSESAKREIIDDIDDEIQMTYGRIKEIDDKIDGLRERYRNLPNDGERLFGVGKKYVNSAKKLEELQYSLYDKLRGLETKRSRKGAIPADNPNKLHLVENYEARQIVENMKIAAENGLTAVRYPTPDTAAKIEGYLKEPWAIDELGNKINPHDFWNFERSTQNPEAPLETLFDFPEGRGGFDYTPEHQTILKKYSDFPKKFKKMFKGLNVRVVTDKKGNTWYEVDVPKDFLKQEWVYDIGAAVTAGSTTLKQPKLKTPHYASGKDSGIHIKPENRGKFTRLKKRTGKSASWFKAHGTPAQKKMAVFALNSRKWSHKK